MFMALPQTRKSYLDRVSSLGFSLRTLRLSVLRVKYFSRQTLTQRTRRLRQARTAGAVTLLLWVILTLPATESLAQPEVKPKRVVVLYWYDKNFIGHVRWDQGFKSALESFPTGSLEYYPEYLEAN